MLAASWESIWNLKRDVNLDASASADSAELRPILAKVAWNMFLDRPLLGCGFGQYDRERLPYLADRSGETCHWKRCARTCSTMRSWRC